MHGLLGRVLVGCSLLALVGCADNDAEVDSVDTDGFPAMGSLVQASGERSFRFGAASAATQIEDQNENVDWYVFTQPKAEGGLGQGHAPLGQGVQGYSRAQQDIELIRGLNLDSYRFSIEWARIEPQRNQIDEAALKHYSDLIDGLIAAGIRPLVTVHHFSNPVWVDDPQDKDCKNGPSDQNLCGLGHPQGGALVVQEMAEHAKLLAERFGDRVDEWGTVNEPVNYLLAAYGVGTFPPGKNKILSLLKEFVPIVRDYVSAHAGMYQALKQHDTVDADQDGRAADVGLTLSVADWVPASQNELSDAPVDVEARDKLVYVFHYLFVDALMQGRFDADLDGTLDEDQPTWKGTLDWLGLQYYFRAGVSGAGIIPVLELTPCFGTFDLGSCVKPEDPTFCVPTMGYEYNPSGLYRVLSAFSQRYPSLPLLISESGIATTVGERRAENIVRSLEQILRARREGADVRGYYHWSLYDNFEWAEGYEPRFGLYQVDLQSYERSPTLGAEVLAEISSARDLSAQLRERYGGTGPMTPPADAPAGEFCHGRQ